MRFDLPVEGEWEAASEACREAFGLGPEVGVFAFPGVAGACWEIALSLARAIPHRRTVAYWKGEGALFEELAGQLSSDGCVARALDSSELLRPTEWLDPIKRDLLLTLESVDDPVSGEPLAAPAFDAALKDARVVRLRVSHGLHRRQLMSPGAYEAWICSIDAGLAVAVCGARVKVEAPIASRLAWRGLSAGEIRNRARFELPAQAVATAAALASFAPPEGARAIPPSPLAAGPATDRVLFFFDDVDGSSVLAEAQAELGFALAPLGEEALAEAGSSCRWTSPNALAPFLKERGLDARAARGLIALAPAAATPAARAALQAARRRVLAAQVG